MRKLVVVVCAILLSYSSMGYSKVKELVENLEWGPWSLDIYMNNVAEFDPNNFGLNVARRFDRFEPTLMIFRYKEDIFEFNSLGIVTRYYFMGDERAGLFSYGGLLYIRFDIEGSYFSASGSAFSYILGAGGEYSLLNLVYIYADINYYQVTVDYEMGYTFLGSPISGSYTYGGEPTFNIGIRFKFK